MLVNFYKDPIDLEKVKSDLANEEVVVLGTMLSRFREIASQLESEGVTDLAAKQLHDKDWTCYLITASLVTNWVQTNALVMKALKEWQAKGSRTPCSVYVS